MTRGKNMQATIQNYNTISSPESTYACNGGHCDESCNE